MYLVCKDNPKFEETGLLIAAAKELGLKVFDTNLITEDFFIYGVRPFVLPLVDDDFHIFRSQEYIYDYSFLLSIGLGHSLFNYDAKIIPAGQFIVYQGRRVFVRPNSGNKQFSGTVIDPKEIRTDICYQFNINPWELIVFALERDPPKEEYRFFCIRNNKDEISMVGCRYLQTPSNDIPSFVQEKAKLWAEHIFERLTIGNSFVLDIFYDPPEYLNEKGLCSIGELNSWNSSGFYCISPLKLLEMITSV